ncbi:MAG: F0F1 ATP synthase subunit A [Microbacteriaceae bacterium]
MPGAFATEGEGFHSPTLGEFLGLGSIFHADGPLGFLSFLVGTPFDMDRIVMVRIFAVTVLIVLFYFGLRRTARIPGKLQSLVELGMGFVKVQIADAILGERIGRKYLPLLSAMFFGITFMNITGVIPFLNIAGTSLYGMPLVMALFTYIGFVWAGIREVGGLKFLKAQLFPSGVPVAMYILLTPIEFINIFIVRPISLSLRLLLNMVVGHILLVLCFAATHFFFFTMYSEGMLVLIGVPTLLFGFIFTVFELGVAVLQAYVFTLLTASYIQTSVTVEH